MFWLNNCALLNIDDMSSTPTTSQPPPVGSRTLLNDAALSNMPAMDFADAVFNDDNGKLKIAVLANIPLKFSTSEVSQFVMSELNASALLNAFSRVVTPLRSGASEAETVKYSAPAK